MPNETVQETTETPADTATEQTVTEQLSGAEVSMQESREGGKMVEDYIKRLQKEDADTTTEASETAEVKDDKSEAEEPDKKGEKDGKKQDDDEDGPTWPDTLFDQARKLNIPRAHLIEMGNPERAQTLIDHIIASRRAAGIPLPGEQTEQKQEPAPQQKQQQQPPPADPAEPSYSVGLSKQELEDLFGTDVAPKFQAEFQNLGKFAQEYVRGAVANLQAQIVPVVEQLYQQVANREKWAEFSAFDNSIRDFVSKNPGYKGKFGDAEFADLADNSPEANSRGEAFDQALMLMQTDISAGRVKYRHGLLSKYAERALRSIAPDIARREALELTQAKLKERAGQAAPKKAPGKPVATPEAEEDDRAAGAARINQFIAKQSARTA